jgi:hypothetical protein
VRPGTLDTIGAVGRGMHFTQSEAWRSTYAIARR